MAITYDILDTPKAQEVALAVYVEKSVMAENPDILPEEGVLYSQIDAKLMPQDLSHLWNDYRYLGNETGNAKNLVLIFGKVKSQQVRDTPFRTTTSFGNHRWPPILKFLEFIEDNNFPRSTNGKRAGQSAIITGPSYYVREGYIPECNEGSRFTTKEYFSDVPYIINQTDVPVATAVSYDIPGARGTFPECLHGQIEIPPTQTASGALTLGGVAVHASGSIGGQIFPRTNFTEWSMYRLTAQQSFKNGYYKIEVWVEPPLVPKLIIR